MVKGQTQVGPRLEALLHERAQLRIKISLAEDTPSAIAGAGELRRRVSELDRKILKSWESLGA